MSLGQSNQEIRYICSVSSGKINLRGRFVLSIFRTHPIRSALQMLGFQHARRRGERPHARQSYLNLKGPDYRQFVPAYQFFNLGEAISVHLKCKQSNISLSYKSQHPPRLSPKITLSRNAIGSTYACEALIHRYLYQADDRGIQRSNT